MKKTVFIIREMRPTDITGAMKLSTAEGWNQTANDWKFLIENPRNTCIVAEYSNTIIGTTTAMNYSGKVAWIGMVLVDKEFRGQGVSMSMLTDILKKLSSFKSVKLDATPAGQNVYKIFGFKDEFEIVRMTNLSVANISVQNDEKIFAECIEPKTLREIIDFDEYIFGVNRSSLIKYLLSEYPQKAWMIKRNNLIAGIALGRAGNKYHHIGLAFAHNFNDVKILVASAASKLKYQPIVVDVLFDKKDIISWLSTNGFVEQRKFMRMYKGENLFPGNVGNQYLICGPEFG
jgi:predicted GNAT family N-acyltransferase